MVLGGAVSEIPPSDAPPATKTCAGPCALTLPGDDAHFRHHAAGSVDRVCRACRMVADAARFRAARAAARADAAAWPLDPTGPIRSAHCQASGRGEERCVFRRGTGTRFGVPGVAYRVDRCREAVVPGDHARWCAEHAPQFFGPHRAYPGEVAA